MIMPDEIYDNVPPAFFYVLLTGYGSINVYAPDGFFIPNDDVNDEDFYLGSYERKDVRPAKYLYDDLTAADFIVVHVLTFDGEPAGWISFINEDGDVRINDYTVNLDDAVRTSAQYCADLHNGVINLDATPTEEN